MKAAREWNSNPAEGASQATYPVADETFGKKGIASDRTMESHKGK